MVLVVVVALFATIVVLSKRGASNFYVYSPGSAPLIVADQSCTSGKGTQAQLALPDGQPCARLEVGDRAHPIGGQLHMVDVLVGPASWVQYALSKVGLLGALEPGSELVPAAAVLGNTPPSQLLCQDAQQAVGSTEAASVAAVRRLGYQVKQNELGAQVDTVTPHTAAASAGVECNDLITAFDGHPVTTAPELVTAIGATKPGEQVSMTVERKDKDGQTRTLTLHPRLTGTPALDGAAADPNRAFLGISTESRITYTLPFNVKIDVGNIGGPSAGLALTLGLLDTLTNGKLTGGHKIAATGTIDVNGNVGDVGGVAQKAVAVRRAGVQLFLVPPEELSVARAQAGPSMKVEAVRTLNGALADIAAFGGDVSALPAAPGGA